MLYPTPVAHVAHFIAYLSLNNKSINTVRSYTAAITWLHRINLWPNPTSSFIITKLLKGLERSNSQTRDKRLPITYERLIILLNLLPSICYNEYETILFTAAFTMAFYGFLRISELLGDISGGYNGIQTHHITLNEIITLFIGHSKTDQSQKGTIIQIKPVPRCNFCPLRALHSYLKIRPRLITTTQLFIHANGNPLTHPQLRAVLSKAAVAAGWPADRFTSHSFRIGAATTAAIHGHSDEFIMKKGRWASDAMKTYIRM